MTETVKIILPTNKLSGGTFQAIQLANDLEGLGIKIQVICMFKHHEKFYENPDLSFLTKYTLPSGKFKLLALIFIYIRYLMAHRKKEDVYIYTHFFTYPIFSRHRNFMLFIQGHESNFIKQPILSFIIKKFINYFIVKSDLNIIVSSTLSISREKEIILPNVLGKSSQIRKVKKDIKLLFCYSNSHVKNPKFYEELFKQLGLSKTFKVGVVELSPFPYKNSKAVKFTPQKQKQFLKILSRSEYFLVASLSEGFSLTVIEALINGAIVFVTEFGGVGTELLKEIPFCKVKKPKDVIEKVQYLESNKFEKERLKKKCMNFLKRSEHLRYSKRSKALSQIARKLMDY